MNVTLKLLGGPQDGFEFLGDPVELSVHYLDPARNEVHTYVRGNGRTYSYLRSEKAESIDCGDIIDAIDRFEAARDAANETDARYNE